MSMMYKKYKIKDLAIVNPSKKAIKDLSPNADVSFIPMDCVSNEGKILKMETKKYFLDGKFIGDGSLTVIAGPCSLESPELGLRVAKFMKKICEEML